jgi:hypothetical protein
MRTPPTPPRRRSRGSHLLGLLLLATIACSDHTVDYTQAQDDAALALVASTWTEPVAAGLVLSLCEDTAASDAWTAPTCEEDHVIRGGGRALVHTETHPTVGCGGCLFLVRAYVVGTVSGGPFAAPTTVRGRVTLQSGNDTEPYASPWSVSLDCEGAVTCSIVGTIDGGGAMAATLTGAGTSAAASHALARTADASCP